MIKIKIETKVLILYLLIGSCWILFSDQILVNFIREPVLVNEMQTYKGWVYVVFSGFIFYYIILRVMSKLRARNREIQEQYEEAKKANQEVLALNSELKEINNQVQIVAKNFETLIDLILEIGELDIRREDVFLSRLLNTAIQLIPEADCGSIYVFKNGKIHFIDAVGYDCDKLNELEINEKVFTKTDQNLVIVDRIDDYTASLLNPKESMLFRKAIQPITIKQSLIFGLFDKGKRVAGVSLDISRENPYTFTDKSIRIMKAFQNLASAFYAMARYKILQGKFQSDVIISLLRMLEIHDVYTIGHSQNVAVICRDIAREMKLSEELVTKAYLAGQIHDIGKTLIPDYILNKKGRLSKDEYKLIQKHPLYGYEILKNCEELQDIALFVLYHHERWDGRGYPEGLKGREIPLISRIISTADAWDAMCSRRSYRQALNFETALKEIMDNAGKQFCPEVAKHFCKMIKKNKKKYFANQILDNSYNL